VDVDGSFCKISYNLATTAAVSTAAAAVTVSVWERSKRRFYKHVENQNLTTVVGGGHVPVARVTVSILSFRDEGKTLSYCSSRSINGRHAGNTGDRCGLVLL
jgi:hypothetical protein